MRMLSIPLSARRPSAIARLAPLRMIVFDIDGTLLPTTGGQMSERTKRAILATEAAGIEVVIATGRRQAYAAPLLAQLGLRETTILISSNGTVTRNFAGVTLDRSFLDRETSRALCAEVRPFGGTTVFTFDRPGRGELILESLANLNERIEPWVAANLAWIEEINPLELAFDAGDAPIQGMLCGTLAQMQAAEAHLVGTRFATLIEMHQTQYAPRDLSILDLLPPGCNKGTAVARLAAQRGIAQDAVMAIGDNWNDLEMLKWAGQPVLMGNASPQLQALASEAGWQITATNDEDGVAMVLEQLLGEQVQATAETIASVRYQSSDESSEQISAQQIPLQQVDGLSLPSAPDELPGALHDLSEVQEA